MVKGILVLLRPKHWIKNVLVLAPLFFTFAFTAEKIGHALMALVGFCLLSSGVYAINDIADRESDRHHPVKRRRPIASGVVSVPAAAAVAAGAFAVGAGLTALAGVRVLEVGAVYAAMNLAYSFYLKHFAIVDVMIIALGFVMRVMAGAYAIAVPVSHWILLCTFFGSLFVAFGKRKHEMAVLSERSNHRRSAAEYTDRFIDQMLALTAGIAVVFYSFYTIAPENVHRFGGEQLIYTTPIVMFGIFRYFHLMYNRGEGGDPVQLLLKDRQLLLCMVLWLLTVGLVYLHGNHRLFL